MAAISIRIDDVTKKQFDEFCESVGLSVSAAFNLFAKTVVREQRIPFEIRSEIPNRATEKAMAETQAILDGKIEAKSYNTAESMMQDLLAADNKAEYKL